MLVNLFSVILHCINVKMIIFTKDIFNLLCIIIHFELMQNFRENPMQRNANFISHGACILRKSIANLREKKYFLNK